MSKENFGSGDSPEISGEKLSSGKGPRSGSRWLSSILAAGSLFLPACETPRLKPILTVLPPPSKDVIAYGDAKDAGFRREVMGEDVLYVNDVGAEEEDYVEDEGYIEESAADEVDVSEEEDSTGSGDVFAECSNPEVQYFENAVAYRNNEISIALKVGDVAVGVSNLVNLAADGANYVTDVINLPTGEVVQCDASELGESCAIAELDPISGEPVLKEKIEAHLADPGSDVIVERFDRQMRSIYGGPQVGQQSVVVMADGIAVYNAPGGESVTLDEDCSGFVENSIANTVAELRQLVKDHPPQ